MNVTAKKERTAKLWREWRGLMLTILILTAVRSAIADWNDVPSGSMNPTIVEGDRLFVNKLAYDLKIPFTTRHIAQWSNPKRGDIVVFFSPTDRTRLVKRVIGLPGDRIEMVDDHLYVNGVAAQYEKLPASVGRDLPSTRLGPRLFVNETVPNTPVHPVTILLSVPAKRTFGPIEVKAGQYFMMGDNRDDSNHDSRFWGTVDRRLIVGRATMVVMYRSTTIITLNTLCAGIGFQRPAIERPGREERGVGLKSFSPGCGRDVAGQVNGLRDPAGRPITTRILFPFPPALVLRPVDLLSSRESRVLRRALPGVDNISKEKCRL